MTEVLLPKDVQPEAKATLQLVEPTPAGLMAAVDRVGKQRGVLDSTGASPKSSKIFD